MFNDASVFIPFRFDQDIWQQAVKRRENLSTQYSAYTRTLRRSFERKRIAFEYTDDTHLFSSFFFYSFHDAHV